MTALLISLVVLLSLNLQAAVGIWLFGIVVWSVSWLYIWNEKKRADEGIFRPSDLPPFL